jgi:hypothetical protein
MGRWLKSNTELKDSMVREKERNQGKGYSFKKRGQIIIKIFSEVKLKFERNNFL